ncbi:MAG: hypothetical protein QXM43_07440 [Desulfurococcaceae archaeon]
MGFNAREWALKWLKGSIIGYMRGEITLSNLLGRVKRCLTSYGVTLPDVMGLLDTVVRDPALNLGSPEERRRKLDPLLRSLDELMKGA